MCWKSEEEQTIKNAWVNYLDRNRVPKEFRKKITHRYTVGSATQIGKQLKFPLNRNNSLKQQSPELVKKTSMAL